jgi:hypothetical protein
LRWYDGDVEFGAALMALYRRHGRRLELVPDWRSIPPLIWVDEASVRAVRDEFEARAAIQALDVDDRTRAWDEQFKPVANYLEALVELAGRFGLDRLGADGVDTIHAWCLTHQELIAIGERWARRRFSEGYQSFGEVIEVGDDNERDLGAREIRGRWFRVTEHDVRPILRIDGRKASWDPTAEPRQLAFARLRRRFGKRSETAIRAELDRLGALADQAGARALDTSTNVDRDLEWLFWHLRHREGPNAVTVRAGLAPTEIPMLRQAVWRIARRADVTLHGGWSDWPEGEVR